MTKIFLALGANVGDKKENIKNAVTLLSKQVTDIKVAPLYKTKPMYFEDQDFFVNTVVGGKTDLSPKELLSFVKKIEQQVGRQARFRNGPREIDIDILFYNNQSYGDEKLIIPHPRIAERDFVLKPLTDLDANFVHPVFKKTVKQLYEDVPEEQYSILGKL